MDRKRMYIASGALAAMLALGGTGVAVAGIGDDGDEVRITGAALAEASAAALEHTGGGEVTDTEVGDEEGYYEVEVTLDDGSQVDVHLDEDFNVLGTEDDGTEDSEDDGDEN